MARSNGVPHSLGSYPPGHGLITSLRTNLRTGLLRGSALLALTFGATLVVQPAHAQETRIINPGVMAVTGFSGTTIPGIEDGLPPGVDPVDETFIDTESATLRIFDVSALGGPPSGQLVNTPMPFEVLAGQIGQVFALTYDDGVRDGELSGVPNLYAGATSLHGIRIVTPDADGDGRPERERRGKAGATFMEGQFAEESGGSPGAIWKIDGMTGAVSLFTTIEGNSGPGIGDVAFDRAHRQFFASDLDSGLIHRIAADGTVVDSFDHGVVGRPARGLAAIADDGTVMDIQGAAFDSEDTDSWGYTQDERRVWGVAVHGGRVYYAVGEKAEIWSVGIARDGTFAADPRWELTVEAEEDLAVTDIAFDNSGFMYLAQRGEIENRYDYSRFADSGDGYRPTIRRCPTMAISRRASRRRSQSMSSAATARHRRPLRARNAAGPEEGVGLCCSQTVDIVIPPDLECPPERGRPDIKVEKRADVARCTPEGGCDFTIRVTNAGDAPYNGPIVLDEVTGPGSAAVVSGPNAPWACAPMASPMSCTHPATTLNPGEWVELKLGFAPGPGWNGRNIRNCAEYDYTASGKPEVFGTTANDKACASIPICRRGDPRCEPPVEKRTDLRITKEARSRVCTADGVCTFVIRVFNNGTTPYVGPLTVIDDYPTGVPASSTFGPTPPWTCNPIGGGQFQCDHPGVNLVPGAFIPLGVKTVVGEDYPGDLIRNCAEVNGIEGETNLENNRACAEMRIPNREPDEPQITVEKTGDKECEVGMPCTFEITITNAGTSAFSGPMRIGDAIGVDGIGRLEGVAISEITPPFGCTPEPTTLPLSCVANISLGAGESRVHQVTVIIPEGPFANSREPASARNCVGVLPPNVPVASAERMMSVAPETSGRPGRGPYACHSFTISREVKEECSQGFVMNADGRCVCPEGTRFRNGQCRPVDGGEPPPPPPPPPSVKQCKLLPGQIRLDDGRCVCPRGTSLVRGQCRKDPPPQCKLLPGQIRLDDGRCVCPRGTSLVRGQCRKDPPPQCKLLPGQIRTQDGRCVCPRGTSLVRGQCRKQQVECPVGTVLIRGKCVERERECPRGTILRNGRCVVVERERCPRGTVGTPPNCRKIQIERIAPDIQRLLDPKPRRQQQQIQ